VAAAGQPLAPATPAGGRPGIAGPPGAPGAAPTAADVEALITEAARDLAEYQRLTAEGKLGEAGQRLDALKRALDRLASPRRP
jgi:hypothetical protein